MSKFSKVLSWALVVAMTVGISFVGTYAYMTSDDSDVNVMTLGNVKIEQHEYERVVDENGNFVTVDTTEVNPNYGYNQAYQLQEFTQGKPAYPAVYSNGTTAWDEFQQLWNQVGAPGSNDLFDDSMKNVVDKFVFVENTGKSDAYYRTIIAIETPEGIGDGIIHTNFNSNNRFNAVEQSDDFTGEADKGTKSYKVGYITIDGVRYGLYDMTYNKILTPGEVSRPSLLQVYLDPKATNEDCALFGDTWDILVVSQAVQAEGFADANTALDAAFGDITTEKHPWNGITVAQEIGITEAGTYELTGDVYTIDTGYFHTQEVTGEVTINGNGATVEGIASSVDAFTWEGGTIPAMSPIFSSADGSTITVNDLSFTGTMSAIMMGHYQNATYNNYNTVFNNVDVIGAEVVSFSSNVAPAVCAYGAATLKNCNIYGTTLSELDTDPMWPVYDLAAVNYSDVTINDSKIGSIFMWNQAKVTVADGSEVDTIVIRGNMNTTKYGLTIKAGATVDTIDLSNITDKTKVNITIEEGATVNNIVANGVTYESIGAWYNAVPLEVSKEKELTAALETGGFIQLTADTTIELTSNNGTVITKDAVIDLNGGALTDDNLYAEGKNGTQISVLTIDNGANVTIKNGTVSGSEYGIYVKNGTLTIENGTYYGATSAVQVYNGTLYIKGGSFKSADETYTINCIDSSYKAGTAVVKISGGEFYRFAPGYNKAEGTGTNFLAEGYKHVRNTETQYYEVVAK